jgi:hypothetical protein
MLLVDISVLTIIFGREYPGREWIRLFVFTFISFAQWRLFIVLIRAKHEFEALERRIKTESEKNNETPLG